MIRWYIDFVIVALSCGIYVVPYEEFDPQCSDPKGFTCGNGADDNLPEYKNARINGWNNLLKEALIQTCGFQLHQMGGYEFLLRLVLSFKHPYFHPRPNYLILF